MEKIKIKFTFGANGYTDPRKIEGSNNLCSDCSKKFSFWDDLQISATDTTLKCANCKGIEIDLITK